jgi:hypothetical protein
LRRKKLVSKPSTGFLFSNFEQVIVHFVGSFPVYGKRAAGVKNNLKLFFINMITDPERGSLEGLVMDETYFAARVNNKTDIQGSRAPERKFTGDEAPLRALFWWTLAIRLSSRDR